MIFLISPQILVKNKFSAFCIYDSDPTRYFFLTAQILQKSESKVGSDPWHPIVSNFLLVSSVIYIRTSAKISDVRNFRILQSPIQSRVSDRTNFSVPLRPAFATVTKKFPPRSARNPRISAGKAELAETENSAIFREFHENFQRSKM